MPGWFDHWPKTKLFLGALLFRLLTALLFKQPGYSDGYYYANVAEALWRGRGFREDYIWNYLGQPLPEHLLNNPSSLYWMPFTSILIAGAYLIGGSTAFIFSQLPGIILSAGLASLAYLICQDFFGPDDPRLRRYGWLCGGLTIFCGLYAPWFTFPDNFAPFAFLSCSFLILFYRALALPPGSRGRLNWFMVGAGICGGLAYLTRVDGLLLLIAAVLTVLLYRYLLKQPSGLDWGTLGLMGLAFVVTISPWLLRNLVDTGQLMPGGGTKTLFWREYNDFFTYKKPLDLAYYLNLTDPSPDWGIVPLLQTKIAALIENLWTWGRGALFLSPFMFVGLLAGRPFYILKPALLVFLVYSVLLYLAMSLAFTFPSTRGSVFHSTGGLLPFIFLASLLGLDAVIDWISRRYRPKAAERRKRTYGLLVLLAFVLISLFSSLNLSRRWNDDYDQLRLVEVWLDTRGGGEQLIMVPDVPAFYYVTHRPALVLSSDSLETNLELAHRYHVRYLMIQPLHLPDSLAGLSETHQAAGLKLVAMLGEVQLYEVL